MTERLREILALLDDRSSRERFMICFVLLATVFVIWNSVLMRPLKQRSQLARAEIEANRTFGDTDVAPAGVPVAQASSRSETSPRPR